MSRTARGGSAVLQYCPKPEVKTGKQIKVQATPVSLSPSNHPPPKKKDDDDEVIRKGKEYIETRPACGCFVGYSATHEGPLSLSPLCPCSYHNV